MGHRIGDAYPPFGSICSLSREREVEWKRTPRRLCSVPSWEQLQSPHVIAGDLFPFLLIFYASSFVNFSEAYYNLKIQEIICFIAQTTMKYFVVIYLKP